MASLPRFLPSALLLLAGCSPHEPAAAPAVARPPAAVRVAPVAAEDLPQLTEITGTVRPARRAVLAAKVMGAISALPATLGQPVRAGDLLLEIAAAEIPARAAQARAQLNLARRDLARERKLLAAGASTAEMVKGLEDRFALTEAMVQEAEAMLGYTQLRAPFDGVVARKFVHAGDLASPGQPLLEVEGTVDYLIEAGIPDSLAAALAPAAAPMGVLADRSFPAPLRELSSSADAATRTVTAKFAVPAGTPVRSGQFVRLLVPGPVAPVLLVPATALRTRGQLELVFVAGPDGRAGLRLVKSGAPRGDRVEILSGLSAGERVVLDPPAGLREGQLLEVRP